MILISAAAGVSGVSAEQAVPAGVEAFQREEWGAAVAAFLDVLATDPRSPKAHAYIDAAARQMEREGQVRAAEERTELLQKTQRILASRGGDPGAIQVVLERAEHEKAAEADGRLHQLCEQARTQAGLGHHPVAYDLIFQALAEDRNYLPAHQLLSDLQSLAGRRLTQDAGLPVHERYALEGFYAFGQADYAAAEAAWQKTRVLLDHGVADGEAGETLRRLRFAEHEKVARAHVDETRRQSRLRALFDKGQNLFGRKRYVEALDIFRQLAIQEPEFPQLGPAIVRAEAAAEQERSRRLGEARRAELARAMEAGRRHLEQSRFQAAEMEFQKALALDPEHAQARSYLSMAQAESRKQYDPRAAQERYDAGLVAYASGKLEDAIREWKLAVRHDPRHDKAALAITKTQRELAAFRELP